MRIASTAAVVAALVAALGAAALAAPRKVAFDGLFRDKASWQLPCEYDDAPHGDLTCAVDHVAATADGKRAHLTCSGQDDILGDIHDWALEPRTLVATDRGLWSIDDDGPDGRGDVAHATAQPPLLASKPAAGKRRRDDDPNAYAGMWFVTSQLDDTWCVGKMPFGWGGGTHVWVVCYAPDGAVTGVAGMKIESRTSVLRCGHVPDPRNVLAEIQRP